jgi:plasmid stabilization system protein ParE
MSDLDGIASDLRGIPSVPALRIGRALQAMLESIAIQPQLGMVDLEYSDLCKAEVRGRVCHGYVLYYIADIKPVLILGILHGKRDVRSIMRQRLG